MFGTDTLKRDDTEQPHKDEEIITLTKGATETILWLRNVLICGS